MKKKKGAHSAYHKLKSVISQIGQSLKQEQSTSNNVKPVAYTEAVDDPSRYTFYMLGVDKEKESKNEAYLTECPSKYASLSMFNDMRDAFKSYLIKKRQLELELQRHNWHLEQMFSNSSNVLNDKITKFGALVGSFNILQIPRKAIEDDIIIFKNIDFVSLADSYSLYLPDQATSELNLNFCLADPVKLSQGLKQLKKQIEFVDYNYNMFYESAMKASFDCFIKHLFFQELQKNSEPEIVSKNVTESVNMITRKLFSKDKKIANAILKKHSENIQNLSEEALVFSTNKEKLAFMVINETLSKACKDFDKQPTYIEALATTIVHLKDMVEIAGSCINDLSFYHAVMQQLHVFFKNVLTYVLRKGILTPQHFNKLLTHYAKTKKLSTIHYTVPAVHPLYDNDTVTSMALFAVRRLSHVQLVHDFMEAKKKELSNIITMMKAKLIYFQNLADKKKCKRSVAKKKILLAVRKSKAKLLKKFNAIRKQYIDLLKMRYEEHYNRNYLWFFSLI